MALFSRSFCLFPGFAQRKLHHLLLKLAYLPQCTEGFTTISASIITNFVAVIIVNIEVVLFQVIDGRC